MSQHDDPAEFHCWFAADKNAAMTKGAEIYRKYSAFLQKTLPVVDLGCGEGALLAYINSIGFSCTTGIESNAELVRLARSYGVAIRESDILEYLMKVHAGAAQFLYIDVIEHLPFSVNLDVLNCLPGGSRIIIQTPYTNSVLGHQFYLNVPSHVAPYSPFVLREMLRRAGYSVVTDGTVDCPLAPSFKTRVRRFLVKKVTGLDPDLFMGGGNYFVVADRVEGPCLGS